MRAHLRHTTRYSLRSHQGCQQELLLNKLITHRISLVSFCISCSQLTLCSSFSHPLQFLSCKQYSEHKAIKSRTSQRPGRWWGGSRAGRRCFAAYRWVGGVCGGLCGVDCFVLAAAASLPAAGLVAADGVGCVVAWAGSIEGGIAWIGLLRSPDVPSGVSKVLTQDMAPLFAFCSRSCYLWLCSLSGPLARLPELKLYHSPASSIIVDSLPLHTLFWYFKGLLNVFQRPLLEGLIRPLRAL